MNRQPPSVGVLLALAAVLALLAALGVMAVYDIGWRP